MNSCRNWKFLAGIVSAAFLLRLFVWIMAQSHPESMVEPDSGGYLRLAESITSHQAFGYPRQPEIFRTPGYPVFLGLCQFVSDSLAVPTFIQIILDVVICLLIWHLGSQMFSNCSGMNSAVFHCLSVVSIVYANMVLSESMYSFFMILFLVVFNSLLNQKKRSIALAVSIGILLSILTYLRPITLIYVYIPLVTLVLTRKFVEVAFVSFVFVIMLAPWYTRNYIVTGYPHFSSVGAINLYRYNACQLSAAENQVSFEDQQRQMTDKLFKHKTQAEQARFAMEQGRRIILNSPFRYIRLHLQACVSNLLPASGAMLPMFGIDIGNSGTLAVVRDEGIISGIQHYFQGNWWILISLTPTIFLLLIAYCASTVSMVTRAYAKQLTMFDFLLIITLVYFLLVPGSASYHRFRVPVAPIFSLYAGDGICRILMVLRRCGKWK